jgi:hypothetical protein
MPSLTSKTAEKWGSERAVAMSKGNLFLLSIEGVVAHCCGCWLCKWACAVAKLPTAPSVL